MLEEHARSEILVGRPPLNAQEEEDLAEAIHAALFGVGRLQPLLEDQNIENIDINGCDRVFIGYADGSEVLGEPVAESDEELVELIQVLAAYSGLSSRPFDTANPQLDLRLPDGSRLSAVMDVTLRPAISIRRARMGKVFLADLVGNGTISPDVGAFLAAAVAARKNIMIAGATNAGKTTLLRALANQIPAEERLITVERALELGLDHFPELHPNVVAFEERLPNSEGQGAITMADLVRRSLRMNPSRVIVGEVLGDEIVTMLNAMTQGNDGSLSTIHSNSSLEVFNRISTYAIQSAERLPGRRHPHADRGRDRLRGVPGEAERVHPGRPAAPVRQQRPRGDRRGRPGALQRGVRPGPGRPGRCRTRPPPAWTSWPRSATTRRGEAGGELIGAPAARGAGRRARRRGPVRAHRGHPRPAAQGQEPGTQRAGTRDQGHVQHPRRDRGHRRDPDAADHPVGGRRRSAWRCSPTAGAR